MIRYIPRVPEKAARDDTRRKEEGREGGVRSPFSLSYLHLSGYHASLTAVSSTEEGGDTKNLASTLAGLHSVQAMSLVQCGVRFPPVIMDLLAFPEVDDYLRNIQFNKFRTPHSHYS